MKLIKLICVTKIQRWLRKLHGNCPITLEPIKYPCFVFATKGANIYYNIEPLKDFLITTGDFRDPNTRELYTDSHLQKIDALSKSKKSVYKASKNTKFYKKIKEKENESLILERELDRLIDKLLIEVIDDDKKENRKFILDTVFLISYKIQLERLKNRSMEHAEYAIRKNIEGLEKLNEKIKEYNQDQKEDLEYVIYWLYQLKFNEIN